ncbi:N-acetyltransferase B complex non catalytic subunit-domain-containing protein [Globomyces pollinis-pini]|nr:N-acetyltransferase B complex non catalytic subunit-domain-containing protein [Globomyces pollinis-pini]
MSRLDPIYDAIDQDRNKFAIQICDKAMKKNPNAKDFLTLKALKAYALCRSGLYQQSYDVAYEVKQQKPLDVPTLQAVYRTLKIIHMFDDIIDMYSYAFNQTNNEEYALIWFMTIAQKSDWKALQQAATKIIKQFNNDKYYFYSVMAIYLQTKEIKVDKNKGILLMLAERMMDKGLKDGRTFDFESTQLYLFVLKDQKNFQKALDLLEGPLAHTCKVEAERKRMCMDLMKQLNNYDSVVDLSKQMIMESPDDWDLHLSYMESLQQSSNHVDESAIVDFYHSLQSTVLEEKYVKRGPFMAEAYFLRQSGSFDLLPNVIIKYVKQFGTTLSCFEDLFPILPSVPEDQYEYLLKNLEDLITLKVNGSDSERINQTRLNLSCLKLIRFVKYSLNTIDSQREIDQLLDFYRDIQSLDVIERERHPGDDYLILAVHYKLDEYFVDRECKQKLFDALVLLEFAFERSKYNYVIKILLIRIYFELGVSQRPLDLTVSMEIKQIQLDTLSFLYTDSLEYFGQVRPTITQLNRTLTIYERNMIETPEMILQAFKFGSFSKIPEFIDFRDQLSQSIQRAITNRQLVRVKLLGAMNWTELQEMLHSIDLEALSIDGACPFLNVDTLADNRDVRIVTKFVNTEQTILSNIRGQEFPKSRGTTRTSWINLFTYIPLLLSNIVSPEGSAKQMVSTEDFEKFIKESEMSSLESLQARVLELLQKHKAGILVQQEMSEIFVEMKDTSSRLQKLMSQKRPLLTFDFCQDMTWLLEAYNMACIFTVLEKDREWSVELTKQLKELKKALSKFHSSITSYSRSSTQYFEGNLLDLKVGC